MLTYCPIEATRPTRTHTIAVKTFDGCVLGEKKKGKDVALLLYNNNKYYNHCIQSYTVTNVAYNAK